jgi:predicted nucleotidyltransferase
MNITELDSYNLADAVKFHSRLNPRLWTKDEHLLPEVKEKLLSIAEFFQEFLGVDDLKVKDITVSGSNAAYSYTKNSDIDLHLIVEMPDDPVYQELFNAKKYEFNDTHNIKIGGADVELYVQPIGQPHISQGIYSIRNNNWISVPQRKRARVDDTCVRDKVASLDARIHGAVKSKDLEAIAKLWNLNPSPH